MTNANLIKEERQVKPAKAVRETFPVLEMTCAACAVSVESMLKSAPGVADAGVNFANATAWVEYKPEVVSKEELRATVKSIGYDLLIERENAEEKQEQAKARQLRQLKSRTIWSSILSFPLVVIGMFFMNMWNANWIMMALATPVVFYFGKIFFINAWKQARYRKANMDTLVALSTGIAYLFSVFNTVYPEFWHARGVHAHVYFEAAAVVIAFISLGKLLEEKAKSNTSSAIKKLMGLQPKTVNLVLEDNRIEPLPIGQVKESNILLVKPGEKIPVDGTVTSGESYVDESMITGEPVAVLKQRNNNVFAGTINQKGSFQFKAVKVGADTILSRIIKLVQDA
ncbi:MAG TPA: heavy metal translocating P-type ATPase [Chitinophagaceae bacterium]|nr:heavy metal translocating P-type ATPase [Chitinophagaceae bacterium]